VSELAVLREGGVAVFTFNRPEKRNALTPAMLEQFEAELQRAADDPVLRAIVLTGAGNKSFSAGMDLGVLFEHLASQPSGEKIRRVQRRLQAIISLLEELEKPTIAAIGGACVGGGLEIALACDLRVASSDAKFGFPEAKIGMIPDLGGTTRLARLVGPSVAKEWIFTGRTYASVRALELGVITELVVPGDALTRARALAIELSRNAPMAIAWAKRVIDRGLTMPARESFELECDAMTEMLPSQDLKEGVSAFLEKREPKFTGR